MKYKLVCFDMDGIVFKNENFWAELYKAFGGKKKFEYNKKEAYLKIAAEVARFCKGKDYGRYGDFVKKIGYNPGAKEVFSAIKRRGMKTALISSGPIELAERAQEDFSVDFVYTNRLVTEEKSFSISGELWMPVRFDNKDRILESVCTQMGIGREETISVGHDEDDINLAKVSGLAIAFNPKSKGLEKACKHTVNGSLKGILKHLK